MSLLTEQIAKIAKDALDLEAKAEDGDENCHLEQALEEILKLAKSGKPRKAPGAPVAPSVLQALYLAYPRHLAPFVARQAIQGAIDRGAKPEWLMERVQLFAKMTAGGDPEFLPYPATWFNQERYNDDENEWKPRFRGGVLFKTVSTGSPLIKDGHWSTGGDASPASGVQDQSF